MPASHGRTRRAQRPADGLERGLGGVVLVAARRLDVERQPAGLGEALEDVAREAGVGLEPELRPRPTAEVDGGAGERVVHRHDRVAVAGDPAPVAERAVERLAERERGVLGRVVGARLEVAHAFEHEVEPAVEGELLEQVVVQARAGGDAHTPGAVEREPDADPRLGRRAQVADAAAAGGGDRRGPVERTGERLEQQVVVLAVADGDADAVGEDADDDAGAKQRLIEGGRLRGRARRGSSRATEAARARARAARAPAARAPRARGATSGGSASAASASAAESVETGSGAWRRFSSAAVSRSASA